MYQTSDKEFLTNKTINYRDPYINLDIEWNKKFILNDKDNNSDFTKSIDYVLMGSKGFLGSEIEKCLKKQNKNYIVLNTRLENYEEIEHKLNIYKPKFLICAAGISGKPTIEWCENNKDETFKTNVIDTLKLCEITKKLNIHLTLFGSGSIYKGLYDNENNPLLIKNTEECKENKNNERFYLKCRNLLEESIELYNNVLYLRIQYPISLNENPKCFMNKMLSRLDSIHEQYVNITFIPNLFPLLIKEILTKNTIGILNFVNPDEIELTTLIEWYKKNKQLNIKYHSVKSKFFCGLLCTDKLSNLTNNEIISIKEVFKV